MNNKKWYHFPPPHEGRIKKTKVDCPFHIYSLNGLLPGNEVGTVWCLKFIGTFEPKDHGQVFEVIYQIAPENLLLPNIFGSYGDYSKFYCRQYETEDDMFEFLNYCLMQRM